MLNEQKITYRMKTLIESGFFGNKPLLTEAFADKDKVRLFQAAYNYTYDKNIAVDGIKGTQTNAAIADVKKQLVKEKLDNEGAKEFYQKFLTKLDENKSSINVGQGGANTNKVLNYAIQALINLAGTPLGIDGVVGAKTLAAIKTVTEDSEVINAENITTITGKTTKNILELGVEDIAAVQGGATNAAQGGAANTNAAQGGAANANAAQSEQGGKKVKFGICLKGNCENGVGELKSEVESTKGNIYIGTFIDSFLTGKDNQIKYASGDSFKGETLDGYPVNGSYTYKSGSVFTGTFNPKSVRSLLGTFKSHEGWSYYGHFNQHKMHGNNSTYTNKNGKQFRLNFVNGKPVGFTWSQLDSQENNGTVTVTKEANNSLFAAEMKKLKTILDTKIKDTSLEKTKTYNDGTWIVQGNFVISKNDEITFLDSDGNQLFKTTNTPMGQGDGAQRSGLDIKSGYWTYNNGVSLSFDNKNYLTRYNHRF